MPILGRWKIGHRFNVVYFGALMASVLTLTLMAVYKDHYDEKYQHAVAQTQKQAERAVELAKGPMKIPMIGARALLADDALAQGPRIFANNCASCHRFDGHDGMGFVSSEHQSASDLAGFASRNWLEGLLDPTRIATAQYFGATAHNDGKMVHFVKGELAKPNEAEKAQLKAVIAALSAEAALKSQRSNDAQDEDQIRQGRAFITGVEGGCTDCHSFGDKTGSGSAPLLSGYGSRQWLIDFINDPSHENFYGSRNDRMPAFGAKEQLNPTEIGLVVDWLRGEWYVPAEENAVQATTPPTSQPRQ
jgi:ubiquinol-cytochrome c reductase cytochrome b subunit